MTSPSSLDAHALLHEKLEALLHDCDQVMDNAKHGQVIDKLDDFLYTEGKKIVRDRLQQKLQERVNRTDDNEETKQCQHCKKNGKPFQTTQNYRHLAQSYHL